VEQAAALETYGYVLGSCPLAEQTARRLVGLPTDHLTKARHRQAVIDLLRSQLRQGTVTIPARPPAVVHVDLDGYSAICAAHGWSVPAGPDHLF
jgi:hypothetical protein